ncbi:unnamed protein product [Acidithrix sp. C25]|nr:unnamed protein product [Acidithrix sp. C25]
MPHDGRKTALRTAISSNNYETPSKNTKDRTTNSKAEAEWLSVIFMITFVCMNAF